MKTIRAGNREFTVRDSDHKRIMKARRGYGADLYVYPRIVEGRQYLVLWAFGRDICEIKTLKGRG